MLRLQRYPHVRLCFKSLSNPVGSSERNSATRFDSKQRPSKIKINTFNLQPITLKVLIIFPGRARRRTAHETRLYLRVIGVRVAGDSHGRGLQTMDGSQLTVNRLCKFCYHTSGARLILYPNIVHVINNHIISNL